MCPVSINGDQVWPLSWETVTWLVRCRSRLPSYAQIITTSRPGCISQMRVSHGVISPGGRKNVLVPSSAPISAAQDGPELPGWVRAIGELIKASRTEKIARSRFNTWPGGFQQLGITPFDHLRNLPSASFVVGERNEIVPWLKPSCRGNRDALFKIVPIEA